MTELDPDFIALARETVGPEMAEFIDALTRSEPTTCIRLNSRKPIDTAGRAVPWCAEGRYLATRPCFTDDPLFHAGTYYVQEASSMFLRHMLACFVPRNARVLDACAAPGGKSTLIADYLSDEGELVSNEFIAKRANILVENITKWGRPNTVVTCSGLERFARLGGLFDCILVDAPCSGEGMFRKDENAIKEWSAENVRICVARQREILANAWQALAENGVLIYSTCTFNALENEQNVTWIQDELHGRLLEPDVPMEWGISRAETGGFHFFPHRVEGEGLFMAAFRKPEALPLGRTAKLRELKERAEWLKEPERFVLTEMRGNRWAVMHHQADTITRLQAAGINLLSAGIQYSEPHGRDMIPATGLALSPELSPEAFPSVDTDLATALAYLRTEAIRPASLPRGYVSVAYQGHPLGWAKGVGTRLNNLYPTYWRIRHQ